MPRRGQLTGRVGREKCTPEQAEFANVLRGVYNARLAHATLEANAQRIYCSATSLSQALGAHRVPTEAMVASMYKAAEESPGSPLPVSLETLLELRRSAAAASVLARNGLTPAVVGGVVPGGDRHNASRRIGQTASQPVPAWDGAKAAAELVSTGRLSELSALMAHTAATLSPDEIALAAAALEAADLDLASDALLRGAGRRGAAFALAVVVSLTRQGLYAKVPAVLAGTDSAEYER
jgi:hypothetical protein